ncbi:MAG: orotidine-5'-phosphate decarboxylase [Pirellulales bacterium]|nr:orotidine-5'-phosphate decarboxylase [Pirellulales bacterium]
MFSTYLTNAIRQKGNPVVVGLDPRWDSLPSQLRGSVQSGDLQGMAAAYEQFCLGVLDVVAPLVPVVKPQAAFFEELGPAGMVALGNVITAARGRKLIVILDGKRNDIGTTAAAYAAAYLRPSYLSTINPQSADTGQKDLQRAPQHYPWDAHALTVSPYLGEDSLTPFLDVAIQNDCGIFVLVKTSNPGGGMFQDLVANGKKIYEHVAAWVEKQSAKTADATGYGCCGAVVGATYPEQLAELRALMPHTWILIPGYGAQGGTAAAVTSGFDEQGLGAVVNNSRGIIFAYKNAPYAEKYGEARWQTAVEAATLEMIEQLRAETPVGRL